MVSRRNLLKIGIASGVLGQVNQVAQGGTCLPQDEPAAPLSPQQLNDRLKDNIYTRLLQVQPHLGAHEHITRLGGNRVAPSVQAAMNEANEFLVDMHELNLAAGKRVAELIGAEDAMITAGGFSAMILAAAGCLTGTDPQRIESLPQVDWQPNECLIPHGHRFEYDRAYRCAGATIVEAADRQDLSRRVGPNTALIAGLAIVEKQDVFAPPLPARTAQAVGPEVILPEELIEFANKKKVPVIIDMASDIPPKRNLTRFLKLGADLVAISGGKGIGGPQSTGILAGRKRWIEAARLNAYPHNHIGRGMKVGKEEVIGLVTALERFVRSDYDVEIEQWNRRARWLADQLQTLDGVTAVYSQNTMGYGDVELSWDPEIIPLTDREVKSELRGFDPKVEYLITLRTRLLTEQETRLLAVTLTRYFKSRARPK
ncbi:MAG: aminotransferase class V-fold PLP-dependent enzyme [Mariniblastus sp.]|nr:aminotransferase class V-fold PLP-dependent enzyme [Mariniblastus sp.]